MSGGQSSNALAMAEAHAAYVQGHKELRPPLLPKPSQDYVERYKARLRVDWSKWDRLSSHAKGGPGVDADGDDEDEEEAPEATAAADADDDRPSTMENGPKREEVWQPDTLSKTRPAQTSSATESSAPLGDVEDVIFIDTAPVVVPDILDSE